MMAITITTITMIITITITITTIIMMIATTITITTTIMVLSLLRFGVTWSVGFVDSLVPFCLCVLFVASKTQLALLIGP